MGKNQEVTVTIEVKGEPTKKFKCESIVAMASIHDGHLMVGSSGMFSQNSIAAYNLIGIKSLQRKLKEIEDDLEESINNEEIEDDTDGADEIVVKVPKELQKSSKELLDLIEKTLVDAVKGDK